MLLVLGVDVLLVVLVLAVAARVHRQRPTVEPPDPPAHVRTVRRAYDWEREP